ncbi:hypothetical protein Zmor_017020 [Zophobas morio]|uniref:TLC domain-containing protein n=1 Tax=Zophobas morio TaxID=2755281 RepID=A0AA38MBH0_9CUCU|nr:hypothetical protein Zmor_017020 [Zophobas morio]
MKIVNFTLNFDPFLGDQRERNFWELLYPLGGSFIILSLRLFLVKFIFTRVGVWCGLEKVTPKKPAPNPALEKAYSKSKKWSEREILGLSKQIDVDYTKVNEWFKLRAAQDKPSVSDKFGNSCWEFFYFTGACTWGFLVLKDKPWLVDFNQCWTDHYNQTVPDDVWWYFMLCFSFIGGQLLGLALDIPRKDYYVMVVHHLVGILSLLIGWTTYFYKFSTLFVLVSDTCNVFLEATKICKYLNLRKLSILVFVLFTLVWVSIRGVIHIFLLKSITLDAPKYLPAVRSNVLYYIFIFCGLGFGLMNLMWTYFLVKVIANFCKTGAMEDARSDVDD